MNSETRTKRSRLASGYVHDPACVLNTFIAVAAMEKALYSSYTLRSLTPPYFILLVSQRSFSSVRIVKPIKKRNNNELSTQGESKYARRIDASTGTC